MAKMKLKTHSGAKKRFKMTKNCKIKPGHACPLYTSDAAEERASVHIGSPHIHEVTTISTSR